MWRCKVLLGETELGDTQKLQGKLPGRKSLCSKKSGASLEGEEKREGER